MAQGSPMPGEKYLHFKNKLYQVIAVAYHSETMERYVVYQALDGDFKVFIRPYDMFISEVDHEKYPQVTQKYRFRYLDPSETESGSGPSEENAPDAGAAPQPAEEVKRDPDNDNMQEDAAEQQESHLNPWLDKILDASSFDEKYKIVCDMQNEVTDKLIDDIAVVMDLAIPEGDLKERYAQLKYCIRTRQKYESGRLR